MRLVAFSIFFSSPSSQLSHSKSCIRLLNFLPRARGDTKSRECPASLRGLCGGARVDKPIYVAPCKIWIKSAGSCSGRCRGCFFSGKRHSFCFLRLLFELLINKAQPGLSKATGGRLEISWAEGAVVLLQVTGIDLRRAAVA